MNTLLQIIKKSNFNVEKFDFSKFSSSKSVAFLGTPISHPYDSNKFVLICDPLSEHTEFIDFLLSDLTNMEHLPTILTDNHESINMYRIWIKEGATAIRYSPFIVTKINKIQNLLG